MIAAAYELRMVRRDGTHTKVKQSSDSFAATKCPDQAHRKRRQTLVQEQGCHEA